MARRRGKSSNKQDDSWLPLEPPAGQSRSYNEYVLPGVLFLLVAVGGSGLGWVCSDHQQTIESLSESLATVQARMAKLQQQSGTDNAQLTNVGGFEERLMALEEAYTKAQRQVEIALATSEQIKSKDLHSKVWSLQTEMNAKLAELQQNTISIAALNAIIKNKSIEFEVVKQSVNTMLSANTELAIQISGSTSALSVTKSRLDEQISVVGGLMSQIEGQKREISEMKELITSNQKALSTNAQELMDIKELLESEQIKRTQTLERQLRSLHRRLEDHQTSTESLHSHLAAQLEAVQTQSLPGAQECSRVEEEVQAEKHVATVDEKEQAPKKETENTEEQGFAEEEEITEEDRAREEEKITEDHGTRKVNEFNGEQADVPEEVEVSERPVEEPVAEIQTPSEEIDIATSKIEEKVAEEHKEVAITAEIQTSEEEHVVTNEIEETAADEIQTALENSDIGTVDTEEAVDDQMGLPVVEEIQVHSENANMVTNETEEQIEAGDTEETRAPLEDSSVATNETEETAVEKEVELTVAEEMQTLSEETDMGTNKNEEAFGEKQAEDVAEEINNPSNEISIGETETQENGNAEQESGSDVEEIQIPTDDTDIATNKNLDSQMRDVIQAETEHEAARGELTGESAKEKIVSEKSVIDV